MSELFHVDRVTFDRWSESGRIVLFKRGDHVQRRPHIPGVSTPCNYALPGTFPPAAFVEAAQPCETCGGSCVKIDASLAGFPGVGHCPDCSNGKRRHPVTVPTPVTCGHEVCDCKCYGGRPHCKLGHPLGDAEGWNGITVAHATVEWGPLPVAGFRRQINHVDQVELSDGSWVDLPLVHNVDLPALRGQWAIGGTIEVAS